jgi:hypothetical protein
MPCSRGPWRRAVKRSHSQSTPAARRCLAPLPLRWSRLRRLDAAGADSPRVARLGAVAASLGGDRGSLDTALVRGAQGAESDWTLAGPHAFDFSRRLGSVLATGADGALLIVEGLPKPSWPSVWHSGQAKCPPP